MNQCRECGEPAAKSFCGRPCYYAYRRRFPNVPSKEGRERIAVSKRGDLNPAKRPEVREKIAESHRASGRFLGERHPNYKGGWIELGYWTMSINNKRVRRSHVVWDAAHPDDPVKPGEVIHHMNHVKLDDRPENLMKITQSQHTHEHNFGSKGRRGWPEGNPRSRRQ